MKRRYFLATLPLPLALAGAHEQGKQLTVYLPDYRVGKDFELRLYGTTHLILFSTAANEDGSINFDRMTPGLLAAGKQAKEEYGVKVLFCIGGWGRSKKFAAATESVESRYKFIVSALFFCQTHHLDGIDLDWEFPEGEVEMANYLLLIKELSEEFKKENRLVTVALGPTKMLPRQAYQWIDLVHLMSYQPWNPEDYEAWMDRSVQMALDAGAPAAKLSVGTPFFAKELGGERRAVSYKKLATGEPLPESDFDFTPIGPDAIDPRIRQIRKHGLAGAMVWDYGHDSMEPEKSMLRELSAKLGEP